MSIGRGYLAGVESFHGADECPERCTICLCDDVCRYAVSTSIPPSWYLPGDSTTELERLGHKDTRALLELHKPLATLARPDVTLVTVLVLELLSLGLSNFDWLQIADELDFLVEDFLVRVVAVEQFRFCRGHV
jgi:hypothetical protein